MKTSDIKVVELTDPAGRKHVALKTSDGWRTTGGVHLYSDEVAADFKVRPLVVLDLDVIYGANQILGALRQEGGNPGAITRHLADQIEAQLPDPKPDEPHEFGAKVRARSRFGGRRRKLLRVRTDRADAWRYDDQDPNTVPFRWDDLVDVSLGWDDESDGAS